MKRHHNHGNHDGVSPELVPVQFEFIHPTATNVCIAGTFNDWQPEAKPMHRSGAGHWLKETDLEPGTYEYCLVVDGQWMPDPSTKETVPNPFGGRNSVLKVTSALQPVPPANAADLPLPRANKLKTRKQEPA